MKSQKLFNVVISALLIIFLSSGLNAQNKTSDTVFVPEVGQKGKDVIWVPSPPELIEKMLTMAKVTSDDYLIDLGSGDGRTVIAAAKKGAFALGIEYNPDMVNLSRRNAEHDGVKNKTEFIKADLYEYDLSKATVITLFLLPEINLKLRPRLLDLKPGTRIVSNTFTMGEWEADYEVTCDENWNSWNVAYMWIVPAKITGKWKLGSNELEVRQEFQLFYGTFTMNGRQTTVTGGRLGGNEITFRVGESLYTGYVDGKRMSGVVVTSDKKEAWDAEKLDISN